MSLVITISSIQLSAHVAIEERLHLSAHKAVDYSYCISAILLVSQVSCQRLHCNLSPEPRSYDRAWMRMEEEAIYIYIP